MTIKDLLTKFREKFSKYCHCEATSGTGFVCKKCNKHAWFEGMEPSDLLKEQERESFLQENIEKMVREAENTREKEIEDMKKVNIYLLPPKEAKKLKLKMEIEEIAEQIHLSGRKYDMAKYEKELKKLLKLTDDDFANDYWIKCRECNLNYPKGKKHYCVPIMENKKL